MTANYSNLGPPDHEAGVLLTTILVVVRKHVFYRLCLGLYSDPLFAVHFSRL
jgi:hypothetical protein